MSDKYLAQLEHAAFDVINGSWSNPEEGLRVLRAAFIENVEHIQDPTLRARVLKWKKAFDEIHHALAP